MKHTQVNEKSRCGNCGKETDGATSFLNHTPTIDDVSICIYCKALSRYNKHMSTTLLTKTEINHIRVHQPQLWASIQHRISMINFIKPQSKNEKRKKGRQNKNYKFGRN